MTGLRNILLQVVNTGKSIIPTRSIQQLSKQSLILPFYHTISDEDCPHIKHLYPVKGTKAFIKDLDFLLRHYKPIDYHDFEALVSNNKQPDQPSFLLSFDDGLKEFHDVIAPILIKKGIPAICFLNSGFVDNEDLFYRYKSSLIIDKIVSNTKLSQKVATVFDNGQDIIQSILSVRYDKKYMLDEIANHVGLNFNNFLANQKPYLSGDQIHSLIDQGFYFGAHSIDHPSYQYLDLDEQIRQTKEGMDFIQNKFSLDYRLFSFPFTDYKVSKEFFDRLNEDQVVDHTFACAGQKNDSIFNHFQRIPFEVSNYSAETILNTELLYYLMKIPFGKNTINRK